MVSGLPKLPSGYTWFAQLGTVGHVNAPAQKFVRVYLCREQRSADCREQPTANLGTQARTLEPDFDIGALDLAIRIAAWEVYNRMADSIRHAGEIRELGERLGITIQGA